MKNRSKYEKFILETVNEIDKTGKNGNMYKEFFKRMSDKEFKEYMNNFIKNEQYIHMVIPPESDIEKGISTRKNLSIAKKWGIKLFHRIHEYNEDGTEIINPIPTLVMPLNFKRLGQHQMKGLAVAEDNKKRNPITEQVSGKSKTGKITQPEVDVLNYLGLHNTLKELLHIRGGNERAANLMVGQIIENGKVSREKIEPFISVTGSTKAVKNIFKGMHIDITL